MGLFYSFDIITIMQTTIVLSIYLAGGVIALYWVNHYRLPIKLQVALLTVLSWACAGVIVTTY
jgi:hypothetical protein